MANNFNIWQATPSEADVVVGILKEAAQWLAQSGMPMWQEHELEPAGIHADVRRGLFYVAEHAGDFCGTIKFQLEDLVFWPDVPQQDAAYIHRLAVCRRYAGTGLSTALLGWAVRRTHILGRRYLRLDCVASRLKLRAMYERFGFRYHSERQVGSYLVSRYEYDVTEMGYNERDDRLG